MRDLGGLTLKKVRKKKQTLHAKASGGFHREVIVMLYVEVLAINNTIVVFINTYVVLLTRFTGDLIT